MKKIIPFLWYDDKAEEAANFYVSIFKNSRILLTKIPDFAPRNLAPTPGIPDIGPPEENLVKSVIPGPAPKGR